MVPRESQQEWTGLGVRLDRDRCPQQGSIRADIFSCILLSWVTAQLSDLFVLP